MVERIAPDPKSRVPPHFYKYRSLRGAARAFAKDLIVNQCLYFSTPRELNDPFEFRPVLDLSFTQLQKREYIQRLLQKFHSDKNRHERRRLETEFDKRPFEESLAKSFRMTMDKIGVFSLSAQRLDVLMWPHYADNHAGICVRFNTMAMVQAGHVPMYVTYCRERPVCHPVLDDPLVMLEKTARTKGLPWAYEEEWRVIVNRGGGQIVSVADPVVSGVILGARMKPQDRNEVLDWVSACKRPMEVFQSRFHEQDYALEGEPVDAGRWRLA